MGKWFDENVNLDEPDHFGSDYGAEVSEKKSTMVVSIIGLVAVGALGYAGYKILGNIEEERKRLTPRRLASYY